MVFNREIIVAERSEIGRAEAVFDLSSTEIAALAVAFSHYRRGRFGGTALSADEVLELRVLGALAEQIDGLAALDGHAVVRTDADEVAALAQATLVYLRERDTESY